jgi:hypothetical protein
MAPSIGGVCHIECNPISITEKVPIPPAPPFLFHHSLVTKDFDALKFHAAASLQLQFGLRHDIVAKSDDRLIVSPYNEAPHLLDLKTLDLQCQLLAKALTILQPIRDDYATAPYIESFNWQVVVDFLTDLSTLEGHQWQEQEFYVVSFRSRLFPNVDNHRLHELDAFSHQEAMSSGGLLKYWFGTKNHNYQNLATCMFHLSFHFQHRGKQDIL